MVSCVFPGSFDPVTKGHFDLISRASRMFDRVTVTVMNNIRKKGSIPVEKRIQMLRRVCAAFPNVSVDKWDGLLAEYMNRNNETIVLRGIRGNSELDQELQSWGANRMLNSNIETVFIPCNPLMNGISSSAVKEIASFSGDIRPFVPDELAEEILDLLSKKI